MAEDEMVEWHHRLNGHEFERAWGDGEGQGSLACCRSWGHKQSDTTQQLNINNKPKKCSQEDIDNEAGININEEPSRITDYSMHN